MAASFEAARANIARLEADQLVWQEKELELADNAGVKTVEWEKLKVQTSELDKRYVDSSVSRQLSSHVSLIDPQVL